MNPDRKIAFGLASAFTALFCVFLAVVIFLTVCSGGDGQTAFQWGAVLGGTVCWLLVILCTDRLLNSWNGWLLHRAKYVGCFLMAVYMILCTAFVYFLANSGRGDVQKLYATTASYVAQGEFLNRDYFYRYSNNISILSLYIFVYRLVYAVRPMNVHMVLPLINLVCQIAAAFLVWQCGRKLGGEKGGIFSLLFLLATLPISTSTAVCYTDIITVPFPLAYLYLYWFASPAQDAPLWKKLTHGFLLAALIGIGMVLKITVFIPVIAITICSCFRSWNTFRRTICVTAAGILLFAGINSALKSIYLPDAQEQQRLEMPLSHWVMMGMYGNGEFSEDEENYSISFGDKASTQQANLRVIRDRANQMGVGGLLDLAKRKTVVSFTDGTLNAGSMLDDGVHFPNWFHEYILPAHSHFEQYHLAMTSLYTAVNLLVLAGALLRLLQKRAVFDCVLSIQLSWFGLWLFMTVWESNSRNITNLYPMMLVCAAGTVPVLEKVFQKNKKREKNHADII